MLCKWFLRRSSNGGCRLLFQLGSWVTWILPRPIINMKLNWNNEINVYLLYVKWYWQAIRNFFNYKRSNWWFLNYCLWFISILYPISLIILGDLSDLMKLMINIKIDLALHANILICKFMHLHKIFQIIFQFIYFWSQKVDFIDRIFHILPSSFDIVDSSFDLKQGSSFWMLQHFIIIGKWLILIFHFLIYFFRKL